MSRRGAVARWLGQRAPSLTVLYVVGFLAYFVALGLSANDLATSQTRATATVGIALMVVFSIVFFWLGLAPFPRVPRRVAIAISLLGFLAACLAVLGSRSSVFLIVVGAMAGRDLPPRLSLPIILATAGGVAGVAVAHQYSTGNTIDQVVTTLVVGLFTYGVARMTETNQQLAAAREEMARLAVVNERLRFARDLHDLLGHSLTVIRAKSELATRVGHADPERAFREMAEVEGVAREALAEVRQAVSGFRQTSLVGEVSSARAALAAAGIAADLPAHGLDVPAPLDDILGWVLREAVTNVVRHSDALHCRVSTSCDAAGVRLEVTDDGHGLALNGATGSGLIGARERLAAVDGTLELVSHPGGGCRLVAWVPRPA